MFEVLLEKIIKFLEKVYGLFYQAFNKWHSVVYKLETVCLNMKLSLLYRIE